MENNELQNQNPVATEGVENEQIASNASKKTLDANEKKKIAKLIQPNILPGKVRIDVNTLTAESQTETVPMNDEVMPELVDIPEPDDEELVEDNTDLDGLNKLQLVEMLEEIVQDADVQSIKDKVAAIRLHFNKLNKEDMDNELDRFLQAGGEAESFQHVEDPIEQRFNAAFGIFKANRAKQNEDLEKQKVENLAKKQAILDELKEIIASDDTLKKTYDDFRALQDRWKEIGSVPAAENSNLWNNYHFLVILAVVGRAVMLLETDVTSDASAIVIALTAIMSLEVVAPVTVAHGRAETVIKPHIVQDNGDGLVLGNAQPAPHLLQIKRQGLGRSCQLNKLDVGAIKPLGEDIHVDNHLDFALLELLNHLLALLGWRSAIYHADGNAPGGV